MDPKQDRNSQESRSKLRSNSKSQKEESKNKSSDRKTQQERRQFEQANQRTLINIKSNQNSIQQSPYSNGQNQSFQSNIQQEQAFFWGTNIIVEETEKTFMEFLKHYRQSKTVFEGNMEVEKEIAIYIEKIDQIRESDDYNLIIDGEHLFQFDKKLYYQTIHFPGEIIPIFDRVALKLYMETFLLNELDLQGKQVQIGFTNLRKQTRIRELGPKDINKLVMFQGIVIRCSNINPEMKDGCFTCQMCGKQEIITVERGRIQEPNDCSRCRSKYSFRLIHNLSMFIDKQYVKLQENPENIPDGETPCTITMVSYESNVDAVKPGDKVQIIGIYRASGQRISKQQRVLNSVFRTYIDVVSYQTRIMNEGQDQYGEANNQITHLKEEDKQRIYTLANDPNIYNKLIKAFAPSIWENEDVKKGLLCQLFGGTQKNFSQSTKGRFRSEINVLLIGDPSTAKSQFLQYVHKISPRGVYTSGKGSSAVGLTAYVTTDPETKELVLESGALVLSDKGICCIDEFDKMNETTRSILHEAMEQQTISVAKAGIVCQLNSRTAILASANPVQSKYNPKMSVIDNIKLGPTLMSRFDLIYLMLDKQNVIHDQRLASHILELYSPNYIHNRQDYMPEITRTQLSQYIAFARHNVSPTLSEQSVDILVQGYCEMRKMGINRNTITATPRQLESLIRLSEAHAKMRLADEVNESDVYEAIRLMRVATQAAATDPITGEIDMDAINTGVTIAAKNNIASIVQTIKDFHQQNYETYSNQVILYQRLFDEIKAIIIHKENLNQDIIPFSDKEFDDALNLLEADNYIIKIDQTNRKKPNIKFVSIGVIASL